MHNDPYCKIKDLWHHISKCSSIGMWAIKLGMKYDTWIVCSECFCVIVFYLIGWYNALTFYFIIFVLFFNHFCHEKLKKRNIHIYSKANAIYVLQESCWEINIFYNLHCNVYFGALWEDCLRDDQIMICSLLLLVLIFNMLGCHPSLLYLHCF